MRDLSGAGHLCHGDQGGLPLGLDPLLGRRYRRAMDSLAEEAQESMGTSGSYRHECMGRGELLWSMEWALNLAGTHISWRGGTVLLSSARIIVVYETIYPVAWRST